MTGPVKDRMWAQRLVAPGRFERCTVPRPDAAELPEGQVLVRVLAGGICGSDLPFFRGGTSPDGSATANGFGRPGFPIHEVVGDVIASKHPEHATGDRVVGWASAFDGIAECVVADGNGLAGYDPQLRPETAILLQPLACVLYAIEQIGDLAGRHVAVVGQGPIGLLFSHIAAARGARRVTGVDRVDRAAVGKTFGVDEVVHLPSDRWAAGLAALAPDAGERPDVVIEAVGHQAATINHAIDAVAFGGKVFYFGIPDDLSYAVNMRTFLRKNLTLQSGATLERRRMLADADDYLRAHPELAEAYVTDVLDATTAAGVTEAFERATRPQPHQIKIVITTQRGSAT